MQKSKRERKKGEGAGEERRMACMMKREAGLRVVRGGFSCDRDHGGSGRGCLSLG